MSIQFLTSLLQYREISHFSEGVMAVKNNNGKWIFIDKNGNEQFGLEFDYVVHNFRDGLAKVELNGQTGVIDTTGKFYQLPNEFKDAEFYSGLACVKINDDENGYGFIDKTGKIKIAGLYERTYFEGDYACVCDTKKHYLFSYYYTYKVIDKSGRTIVDGPGFVTNGKVVQAESGKIIITNLLSKQSICVKYSLLSDLPRDNNNLLAVKKKDKFGFIDMDTGNTVIPFRYDKCDEFSDGLAFVQIGNWKGFINESGEIIIDNYNYDIIFTIYGYAKFRNGFLSPRKNDLWGLIDKTGREIIPPEYDKEIIINENIGKIEKNGQSGFVYLYPTSNGVVPIFCFEPFYGSDTTEIIIDKTKVKINRNGQLLNDNNGYIHPEILADFNSRSPSYHQNNDDYKSDNFKSDDSKVENFQQKLNIPLSDIPLWIKIFPELEGYSLDELEKFLLQQTEIHYNDKLSKLPESIGQLKQLQRLNLNGCINLITLPESIGELQNLQKLDLRYCVSLTTLPESIGQLQNLQSLNLEACENLTTLPTSIGQLQNLQKLSLSGCNNITTLPESIGQLRNLQELYLVFYKNLTTLPESIGQLQNLQKLNLSHCVNLTTLPENIAQLQGLKQLDLHGCGDLTLPKSIINLSKHCEILTDD